MNQFNKNWFQDFDLFFHAFRQLSKAVLEHDYPSVSMLLVHTTKKVHIKIENNGELWIKLKIH